MGGRAESKVADLSVQRGELRHRYGRTWAQLGVGIAGQVADGVSLFFAGDYSRTLGGSGGDGLAVRIGAKIEW